VILAFGGFDPTGGAGVLMDAKAVHAAGGYAAAVPSCLAIQTTATFDRVVPLPRAAMDRALSCAEESFRIRSVKIGMVGTRAAAEAIHNFLVRHPAVPVVFDPVLLSSSGAPLLSAGALPVYRRLLGRSSPPTSRRSGRSSRGESARSERRSSPHGTSPPRPARRSSSRGGTSPGRGNGESTSFSRKAG
jgi:hypothetical protein